MKESSKSIIGIDLTEVIIALFHKIGWIIVSVILFAIGAFAISKWMITPLYQADVMLYVNNGTTSDKTDRISNSDISASQSLVDTYIVILKYGETLDEVVKDAKLNKTPEQLASMISSSSVNGTEVFRIVVTDDDPNEAASIANSIAKVLPRQVSGVIDGSTVRVVSNAKVPEKPSSPHVMKNCVIGAALGFLLSTVAVVLYTILDDTVKDAEKYLKENYHEPVLTAIPELNVRSKRNADNSYSTAGKRTKK